MLMKYHPDIPLFYLDHIHSLDRVRERIFDRLKSLIACMLKSKTALDFFSVRNTLNAAVL